MSLNFMLYNNSQFFINFSIIHINRIDGSSVFFCIGNILKKESPFQSYFSPVSLNATFEILKSCGVYFKTPKRDVAMYCYGSSITASQFPKYIKDGKHSMLPRPYEKSKPGKPGYELLQSDWFSDIIRKIEFAVIYFLENFHPERKDAQNMLAKIRLSKIKIPKELRIGDSFFTHMMFMGSMDKGSEVPIHFDEKDIVTALFHFGSVQEGGMTEYFDGLSVKNPGNVQKQIPFKNGRLQIGSYSSILHKATAYKGTRGTLNFNLKQTVLDHFLKEGNKFFNQYKMCGFPQGTFYAS